MRIIAGEYRGRALRAPAGRRMRPTQGHVRQVLFDIAGRTIAGARVLDLFAGVGALGIEALSRGASSVCFVEQDKVTLACLRENLASLDLVDRSRVLAVSVEKGLRMLAEERIPFDWICADPPYALESRPWLARIDREGPGTLLGRRGSLVLEGSARRAGIESIGRLRRFRQRIVGETKLEFYRWEEEDVATRDLPGDL